MFSFATGGYWMGVKCLMLVEAFFWYVELYRCVLVVIVDNKVVLNVKWFVCYFWCFIATQCVSPVFHLPQNLTWRWRLTLNLGRNYINGQMTLLAGLISCITLYPVIEITWHCSRIYCSQEDSTYKAMCFVVKLVCHDVGTCLRLTMTMHGAEQNL